MSALAAVTSFVLILAAAGRVDRGRSRPGRRTCARQRGTRGDGAGWVIGGASVVGSAVVVAGPSVVLAVGAAAAAGACAVRRGRRARHRREIEQCVPDLAELFLIAAAAGHPVASSLVAVGPRSPDPVRSAVVDAGTRLQRGRPLGECLAELGREIGQAAVPLVEVLAQAAVTGSPLVPMLEDVVASARDEHRRHVQEAARRLPVTMLFPLVGCVLPAAVLLAVVPVLLVSLASLAT